MPRTIKKPAHGNNNLSQEETEVPSSQEDIPSSDQEIDQEPDPEAAFQWSLEYIEGPKMDCTVNDALYHRFLKWWLKCENILECQLAALPE